MKFFAFLLPLAFLFSACGEAPEKSSKSNPIVSLQQVAYHPDAFVKAMEMAHEKGKFLSHEVISFGLELWFGGRKRFDGDVHLTTDTGKLRLDKDDGVSIVYDGDSVYQSPDTATVRGARFDVFTWTYFFALPYKLNDPGVIWTETPHKELEGQTYRSRKLSFEDGTGDSSKDWYILYADSTDNMIRYAAYIVTYSADQEKAEEDPHAIGYSDYQEVDGIPVPMKWTFFGWRENEGLTDTLGHATLSNIRFSDEQEQLFARPINSKVINYQRPAE